MNNFKDRDSQKKFQELTSLTNEFSNCFKNERPLLCQVEMWQEVLLKYCNKSFKKIRIRRKNIKPLEAPLNNLIDERNNLAQKPADNKQKLEEVTNRIAEIEATENRKKIVDNFKHLSENPEQINLSKLWQIFKKMSPKSFNSLPVAKQNYKGKIISNPKELKTLLAREYKDRLRSRPIRPDLIQLKMRKRKIFKMKMKLAECRRSPLWKMSDMDLALFILKIINQEIIWAM